MPNSFGDMLKTGFSDYTPAGLLYKSMTGGQRPTQQNASPLGTPTFQSVPQQGNAWSGYDPQVMTSSPYTGNQQNLMNMLAQTGMQGLQSGRMPGGFDFGPIKQAYEQNYRQNIMPSIAERFASLGGEGAAGSSGFKASMIGGENQLQTQLAGMQSQYMQQMLPQLLQILMMGLRPQYEQQYMPGSGGASQALMGGVGQGIGMLPMLLAGL